MTAPTSPTTLCFVDTETTSLHPELRRPWEIALIRREIHPTGDVDTIRHLVHVMDVDTADADPSALAVGGFYQRHPAYVPEGEASDLAWRLDADAAADFVEKVTRDAHLVAVGVAFDADTLDRMLRRHGLAPAWHHHLVDVPSMAVGHLHALVHRDAPGARLDLAIPWRSDDLSRACGVEPPAPRARHTALGDADWAMRWFDRITGGAS